MDAAKVLDCPDVADIPDVEDAPKRRGRGKGSKGLPISALRYDSLDPQRVEDARTLASWGLGVQAIHELTSYPKAMITTMMESLGVEVRGGRRKSALVNYMRLPMYHASLSLLVVLVERTMKMRCETRLSSRTFVSAVRTHSIKLNNDLATIPVGTLYNIVTSYMEDRSHLERCRQCDFTYIVHTSAADGAVSYNSFECPGCRLIAAMAGGCGLKWMSNVKALPTKMSELNLNRPLLRVPWSKPSAHLVKAVLDMATSLRT